MNYTEIGNDDIMICLLWGLRTTKGWSEQVSYNSFKTASPVIDLSSRLCILYINSPSEEPSLTLRRIFNWHIVDLCQCLQYYRQHTIHQDRYSVPSLHQALGPYLSNYWPGRVGYWPDRRWKIDGNIIPYSKPTCSYTYKTGVRHVTIIEAYSDGP